MDSTLAFLYKKQEERSFPVKDLHTALLLMLRSEVHRNWAFRDIERLLLPPLELGQYRLFYNKGPVGYVSWAFLTKETEAGYINGTKELQPRDWNAGTERWTIDFIALDGNVRSIAKQLRDTENRVNFKETRHMRVGQRGIVRGRYGRILNV